MFSCYFFSKKDNLNLNNNIFFITKKGRMSCFLDFLPDIFFYVIIKSSLLILTFFFFFLFLRFSGVFVNMSLTFQKADMQADLDWWSRNHGTGMPQNWPVFEVSNILFCTVLPIL